jgi:AsmA protein
MKTILKIGAGLCLVLLAAVLALPVLVDANRFRPILERQLSGALGRAVSIGDLRLALFAGGISARDVRVAEDPAFASGPFLSTQSLQIGVDLPALLLDRVLRIESLTIEGAQVSLIQAADGTWNFSSLGARSAEAPPAPAPATPASEPVNFAVRRIGITGSALTLASGQARRQFRDLNIELRQVSANAAVPFELTAAVAGGGAIRMSGMAGPPAAPADRTPFDVRLEIQGLDLTQSGFSSPSSGIGGLLSFHGQVSSNGKTAALTGAVTVDQLRLSPKAPVATRPVGLNLALAHDLETGSGNIARSGVKLGSASATLNGAYELRGAAPRLSLTLEGRAMPLPELLALLPAMGIVLPEGASIEGGTLSSELALRGTTAAMTASGAVRLENAKLTNYDLGAKLRVIQQLAGLPTATSTDIQLLTTRFESSRAGARIESIQLVAPALGTLTGEGAIHPGGALDLRMKAVVKTAGLLAAALQPRGETMTVPFFVRGSASDPKFQADVKSIADEKLRQVIADPEGAAKNVRELVKTGRSLLDMFKKAPPKPPEQP